MESLVYASLAYIFLFCSILFYFDFFTAVKVLSAPLVFTLAAGCAVVRLPVYGGYRLVKMVIKRRVARSTVEDVNDRNNRLDDWMARSQERTFEVQHMDDMNSVRHSRTDEDVD